jgi:2'-5' RNA ligase
VTDDRWYWGVVVRVDSAHALLTQIGALTDGEQVRTQHPATGHVTLFYAPLRGIEDAPALAERARAITRDHGAFEVRCTGFDEFTSPTRPVAWLGVDHGSTQLHALRAALCACDEDCHRHGFVPHLTLAYGEDPDAYAAAREAIRSAVTDVEIVERVDALWVAGFPADGHPARDLRYIERIPLTNG